MSFLVSFDQGQILKFTCDIVGNVGFFMLTARQYFIGWIYHSLFFYSTHEGHHGFLSGPTVTIINRASGHFY